MKLILFDDGTGLEVENVKIPLTLTNEHFTKNKTLLKYLGQSFRQSETLALRLSQDTRKLLQDTDSNDEQEK